LERFPQNWGFSLSYAHHFPGQGDEGDESNVETEEEDGDEVEEESSWGMRESNSEEEDMPKVNMRRRRREKLSIWHGR
jgi:hypothetical protein